MRRYGGRHGVAWAIFLAFGCSNASESLGPPRGSGSVGVGQGGAQDIGEFRAIVARGEVPTSDLLDPLGFFAEHALDLPAADCGERVCVQPMLAVAPRFDGGNWTMAFVALNSAVDGSSEPRPATHVVLAVEATTRTAELAEAWVEAFRELSVGLRDDDRISIVRVGDEAELLVEAAAPVDPALGDAIRSIAAGPWDEAAATYGALALASRVLDGWPGAKRIVLASSGRADAGVRDESRVLALAEAIAAGGTAISVVGMGSEYRSRLPAAIGDLGTGTYSFAEDGTALAQILRLEGRTSLVPLARDFSLQVRAAPGYRIGRIHGARRVVATESTATLSSPMLVLGYREGASDVTHGRRGGGGGMFVELLADPGAGIPAGAPAFAVEASFVDPTTGSRRTLQREVVNLLAPGQNPPDMWPSFSDPARGKPFMMLNMYLALRGVLEFYEAGDCARAMGVADMMQLSVDGWQAVYDDPDIDADNALLLDLRDNVRARCQSSAPVDPQPPRHFDGGCMFL